MLRRLALLPLLLLATPASAHAACGVPAAKAEYETPEVQIYVRGTALRGCLRATGRERVVGSAYDDGSTSEVSSVSGVFGGRYVWTRFSGSYTESADVEEVTLTDLRTGKHVDVRVEDEETSGVQVVAAPGALVATGGGITARYTDGRVEKLSTDPAATGLAISGARVYWQASGAVHTALLVAPAGDPARARPLMRTVGKCKPRSGARLVVRDDTMLVSRAGGNVWVCRAGKTLRVGDVSDVAIETGRYLSYRRPGLVGLFDVARNERHELEGAAAIKAPRLVAAGATGLRLWPAVELAPGPASEPALGPSGSVYWLDGAAAPQMRVLTG